MSYFVLMCHVTARGAQTKNVSHLKAPSERRRNQHAKPEATFRN